MILIVWILLFCIIFFIGLFHFSSPLFSHHLFKGFRQINNNNNDPKTIIIIGASFAGLSIARNLPSSSSFRIIIIDSKNFFEYTPSIINQITATNNNSSPPIRFLITNNNIQTITFQKNSLFIHGSVVKIDATYKYVIVKQRSSSNVSGMKHENFYYDYLIDCSGSSYNNMLKPDSYHNNKLETLVYRENKINEYRTLMKQAQLFVIQGNDLITYELALYLQHNHVRKQILIYKGTREDFLSDYPIGVRRYIFSLLKVKKNIKVINEDFPDAHFNPNLLNMMFVCNFSSSSNNNMNMNHQLNYKNADSENVNGTIWKIGDSDFESTRTKVKMRLAYHAELEAMFVAKVIMMRHCETKDDSMSRNNSHLMIFPNEICYTNSLPEILICNLGPSDGCISIRQYVLLTGTYAAWVRRKLETLKLLQYKGNKTANYISNLLHYILIIINYLIVKIEDFSGIVPINGDPETNNLDSIQNL
jgi:hypothetical protein